MTSTQRPCVCGHVAVHHDKRKSIPQGLMADYKVIWGCGWKDCGCPRFEEQPNTSSTDYDRGWADGYNKAVVDALTLRTQAEATATTEASA